MFRDWQYGAGSRAGKPIHLLNADKGKIAILTTRFPGDEEIDRKIIGFFKIGEVKNEPGKETMLIADQSFAIRLPMEEAKELFFWDYYSTRGGAFWGTGLVRYLDDSQIVQILADLKKTIRDEKAKIMIEEILQKDFPKVSVLPASGPRAKKSGSRARRVAMTRKYGSGGEGKEHKELKEWAAQHPESLGVSNVEKTEIEYVFPSGDAADIVFGLAQNRFVVVEIETLDPLPGCYQALKYKILKCAELGLDINSSDVEAILIAQSASQDVKNFCTKYGIRFVQMKLGTKNQI
jgi:hypothetical protein